MLSYQHQFFDYISFFYGKFTEVDAGT